MNRDELRDTMRDLILMFHGRDGSDNSDMALATGLADVLAAHVWPLTDERLYKSAQETIRIKDQAIRELTTDVTEAEDALRQARRIHARNHPPGRCEMCDALNLCRCGNPDNCRCDEVVS